MKEPKSGGVDKVCSVCSKQFIVHAYRANEAKYCSGVCQRLSMKRGKDFICEECGKSFYVGRAKFHQPNRWCSHKCMGAFYKKNGAPTTTHGLSYSAEHRIWSHMKSRCLNPDSVEYELYGGRGISVCEEWKDSFEAFYKSVGARPTSKHSIDRIDVNGNYEPGNVRWTTDDVQRLNKRNTVYATLKGIKKPLKLWCDELNLPYNTIRVRIQDAGWNDERALTTPISAEFLFCKHGHDISKNTYVHKSGKRECYLCMKRRNKEYSDRLKLKK